MSKDSYKKAYKLAELAKKIDLIESKKTNLENAQNLYYPTFGNSIGLFQIYKLFKFKIKFLEFYPKILKNTFSGIFFSYSKIYKDKKIFNYNNIIFTWANHSNFQYNGSLNDKYFNMNSRQTKNTLWIVIYSDAKIPKNIDRNILIYKNIKRKIKILKFIFFLLRKILSFKNLSLFLHNISNFYV